MQSLLRPFVAAAVLGLAAASSAAQFNAGTSYVVTTAAGLYVVEPGMTKVTTIATPPSGSSFDAVAMDHDNRAMVTISRKVLRGETSLLRVAPTGSMRTLQTYAGVGTGVARDPGSQWVMTVSIGPVYRTSGVNHGLLHTLTTLARNTNAICVDDDTGDYWLGQFSFSPAVILRRPFASNVTTTIASGIARLAGLDHDQRTGSFVAVTATEVLRLSNTGTILKRAPITDGNVVHVDDITGHVHVAAGSSIVEFDAALNVVRTTDASALGRINGLTIWGSRPLAGARSSRRKPGSQYSVIGNFPDSPNAAYACGLSASGLRPGIPVDNGRRMINAFPDPLFLVSAAGDLPFFTTNFQGTTDQNGTLNVRFIVPDLPLLHLVVAVLNRNRPGNLDIAPSLVVYVQ